MMMTGHCLCGAVRLEASAPPVSVTHCHCSMCRRHSGAAVLTYARFDAGAVTFSGPPAVVYRSSPGARRTHCGRCGSPVSFLYDGEPQSIYVVAGILDQANALLPSAHWYEADRLPWLHMEDGLPRHATQPDGTDEAS